MSTSTVARSRPKPKKKTRKKQSRGWLSWWPLVAGVAVTCAAVKTAEILPLMGPGGLLRLELLYPFALLFRQPILGLSDSSGELWSQIMLYAQFPLYGLYASIRTRWKPLWAVVLHLLAFHLVGFGVLWLLTQK